MLGMGWNLVGGPLALGKKIEHHITHRIDSISITGFSRKTIGIGTNMIWGIVPPGLQEERPDFREGGLRIMGAELKTECMTELVK
jgi:hypothetical protein